MDWTEVWQVISKYWAQQQAVLAVTIVTFVYNRKFKRYVADQKAIRLGMLAQLRDRFYQSYKQIVEQGSYPIRDREVMEDLNTQYRQLGGNGVIENLKRELDTLPAYRQKEDERDE